MIMKIDLKQIESVLSEETFKSQVVNKPADGVVPALCGYRTGKCHNLQAVKRNGKLHKLCEYHREKANQNQKKLDRKKRMQRFTPYNGPSSPHGSISSSASHGMSPCSIDHSYDMLGLLPTSLNDEPLALGYEELAIFYDIMTFDIKQRTMYRPVPVAAHPRQPTNYCAFNMAV
jgi:hypothetical protein